MLDELSMRVRNETRTTCLTTKHGALVYVRMDHTQQTPTHTYTYTYSATVIHVPGTYLPIVHLVIFEDHGNS